jgi:hypothetical protein
MLCELQFTGINFAVLSTKGNAATFMNIISFITEHGGSSDKAYILYPGRPRFESRPGHPFS